MATPAQEVVNLPALAVKLAAARRKAKLSPEAGVGLTVEAHTQIEIY